MMKNKQLLDAISSLINGGEFDLTDSPKSLVSNLRRIIDEAKAIAAAEPAQQSEPVPRDVLMALAEEVREEVIATISPDACNCGHCLRRNVDISSIVDRYAAQPPAVAVPECWPTDEMVVRGAETLHDLGVRFEENSSAICRDIAESVFIDMLDAAPIAKQKGGA